ncbi:GNAT family N-acetyltransferase [Massilia sp. S19_KUP03_FR1]|uniref:GNAT family N-acetyltransferase n=1 Tax=Massilia sp. S19_KUP03_FR1 TaxID=3025503 RepID=UPI002FCD8AE4
MDTSNVAEKSEELVTCYFDAIPAFVDHELARLYEVLQSSLAFMQSFRELREVNCYVASKDETVKVVLLFVRSRRRVDVLNEMIELGETEIKRFAQYIFERLPDIDVIHFKAVRAELHQFPRPIQKQNSKHTYLIALPASIEKYNSSMSRKTMTGIRYQTNKAKKTFPSLSSRTYHDEEIDEAHIIEIIRLSESRINSDDPSFSYDARAICQLAKKCGFVHIIFIEGRVCAGTVNYRVGASFFGEVLGQDPEYKKYGLGKICVYQTICESISRGGRKFYLGGGAFDFKTQLLGNLVEMDEIKIYRSRIGVLRQIDSALGTWWAGRVRRLKDLFHQHRRHIIARMVFKIFYFSRSKISR